ncbi:hypothetical protein BDD12DRAFT_862810 [Trichophaea hybrida]|nr:hypothetical protein BDD12DRAFT_862810 [Trichophaea hybrida]
MSTVCRPLYSPPFTPRFVLIALRIPTKRSAPNHPLRPPPPYLTLHFSDYQQALAPRSDGKAITRIPHIGLEVEGTAAGEADNPAEAAPILLLLLRHGLEEITVMIAAGTGVLPLTLQELVVCIGAGEGMTPIGSIRGINRTLSKIRGQSWNGSWV